LNFVILKIILLFENWKFKVLQKLY
jgi:hypothetical protein